MKASELIKILQERIAETGDLEVHFPPDDETGDEQVCHGAISIGEPGKWNHIMLADDYTAEAFS